MENFEFNPDQRISFGGRRPVSKRGGLTGLFMKILGTQDENKASATMLVVAILFFILAGIILWWFL